MFQQIVRKLNPLLLLTELDQENKEYSLRMRVLIDLIGKVLDQGNLGYSKLLEFLEIFPCIGWCIFNCMADQLIENFLVVMQDIIDRHVNLSRSEHITIFLNLLNRLKLLQTLTRLNIKLQRYILNIDKHLLNRYIIVSTNLQLAFQSLNQNFVHLLVLLMELQFLIVDPIQDVLQIGDLR